MLERPISRAGWTRVAFGDVVRLSKARVANPEAARIDRVVGLEHIEPGDLRIRSWGDVADGTTFTTLFKPGQVLFGKRRAYQRKVAVADFEGVCSGDIYVLEPTSDRLMPELLPFLCQTDAFSITPLVPPLGLCRRAPTGPASPASSSCCRRSRNRRGWWKR